MRRTLKAFYIMMGLLSISNTAFAHGEESLGVGNTTVSILFFSFLSLLLTSIIAYEVACSIKENNKKRKFLNRAALICFSISVILCGLIVLYEDENERFTSLDKGISLKVNEEKHLGDEHVASDVSVEYDTVTPTSGKHFNQDAPYGYYPKGKDVQILLHNLEYGDIIIYNMVLEEFNEDKIGQFIFNYINKGPEKADVERSNKYKFKN